MTSSSFFKGFLKGATLIASKVGKNLIEQQNKAQKRFEVNEQKPISPAHIKNAQTQNKRKINYEVDKFICPISKQIMTDPVITPEGISYNKSDILLYLEASNIDPITNNPLTKEMLVNNFILKSQIKSYLKTQNKFEEKAFNTFNIK